MSGDILSATLMLVIESYGGLCNILFKFIT